MRSAGEPGASVPPGRPSTRAGRVESSATSSGSETRPAPTRRSRQSGTAVSSPTMPKAAWSYSTFLSSTVCGAWSVAMQSIVPSRSPSSTAWRSASDAQRRVHLGVRVVGASRPPRRSAEVVRRDLGGDAHARAPWPRRTASTDAARREVRDVQRGRRSSSASSTSRSTMIVLGRRGRAAQAEPGRDRALVHRAACRRASAPRSGRSRGRSKARAYSSARRITRARRDRPAVVRDGDAARLLRGRRTRRAPRPSARLVMAPIG